MPNTTTRSVGSAIASGWIAIWLLCAPMSAVRTQQHGIRDTIIVRAHEGTALAFDVTPDGRTIIFDLLGQLWSLPVDGGTAVPLTNAVRDTADDSDPSVSPDGAWVVFRSDRPRGKGLWLLSLADGSLRQLTDSAIFVSEHRAPAWSADSRRVVYVRSMWKLHLRDIGTGEDSQLSPDSLPRGLYPGDPTWSHDGRRILAAGTGRLWQIDLAANRARPLNSKQAFVRAPAYSPDDSRIAFFAGRDSSGATQLWVRGAADSVVRLVADHRDMSTRRVRWSPNGRWLYYSADGKLWRVSAEGGAPSQIPFEATLSFSLKRYPRREVKIPSPGETLPARGFSGLAIAPDGNRFAVIALGKLWVAAVGRTPRAVTTLPGTSHGLSWSPDGTEVAWSAGRGGTENLFATNVRGGSTRQLTALSGSESLAAWSPDGKLIAFVHWAKPESNTPPWAGDTTDLRLRVIPADLRVPAMLSDTRDLGAFPDIATIGFDRLAWNRASSAVLVFSAPGWPITIRDSAKAVWVGLDGKRRAVAAFPYRPSFVHVGRDDELTYLQDGLLWRAPLGSSEPHALTRSAALYPSVADDGTVLFTSDSGLRIRRPSGSEERLGWPINLTLPTPAPAMVIRNARIFDGTGAAPNGSHDILIVNGRITGIAPTGRIASRSGLRELDAAGRFVMPGLIDVHTHPFDPAILQASLYFGVTTLRELGAGIARASAQRDAVLAGMTVGPRVINSGLMFYPSPTTGGLTSDNSWMPRDSATMLRGLALLRSFGAEHVKMRFPLTFASGAMLVRLARAAGFTVSGHCANPLPLVIAGIGGQEHLDGQCDERSTAVSYDDKFQLYRAAGIWGVPTIYLHFAHAQAGRDTSMAHDSEIEPFLTPQLRLAMLTDPVGGELTFLRSRQGENARIGTRRFHDAGLLIALGSDDPGFPDGLHGELAELVAAGLTPAEVLNAATQNAARILGIERDIGLIAVGKVADLLLLDADPLTDIRNTRRIWRVIQGGRVVNRDRLRTIATRGQ